MAGWARRTGGMNTSRAKQKSSPPILGGEHRDVYLKIIRAFSEPRARARGRRWDGAHPRPLDGLLGALADAGAAAVALGIVDDSDVVLQEDRLVRAVAHAEAAGNAAHLTGLVDQRALILVGALDRGLRGDGLHLDDVARAGHGAGRAAGALFAVDDGHAIDDVDGVKLARAGAVAQTQAAIGAGAGAARDGGRSSAGLDAW